MKAIIPDACNCLKNMAILLGLRPDNSLRHSPQLNLCFLMAKFFIWCCKLKEVHPNVKGFKLLSSQCHTEAYGNSKENSKWAPLAQYMYLS